MTNERSHQRQEGQDEPSMYLEKLSKGTHLKKIHVKPVAEEALTEDQSFPFHLNMSNF